MHDILLATKVHLRDLAIVCFDRRHCQQIPEGTAILAIIKKSHRTARSIFHRVANDSHLLRIRAFPLQETAAQEISKSLSAEDAVPAMEYQRKSALQT